MFQRTELAAGPRVISARLPGSRSVSIAAYVLAGSRLEAADQAGVAHFMEHLTFKGTAGYPSSRAISEAVEGVGGSANAATDRESTVYWARVPRREAGTAMGVLGQLMEGGGVVHRREVLSGAGDHPAVVLDPRLLGPALADAGLDEAGARQPDDDGDGGDLFGLEAERHDGAATTRRRLRLSCD